MITWGAIWGALFGLLWAGQLSVVHLVAGAFVGVLGGLTLRQAVRSEIAAAHRPVLEVPQPVAPPRPGDAEDPLDSIPDTQPAAFMAGADPVPMPVPLQARTQLHAPAQPQVPPSWSRASAGSPRRNLHAAGFALVYVWVFAAWRFYGLVPAHWALAGMAATCAVAIAAGVSRNAMALGLTGFAGAFAGPLLVPTGENSHVVLFGFYLVLGAAGAAIAWARDWGPVNLLGFCATFGVAAAWGYHYYQPQLLGLVEPVLLGLFLAWLANGLVHATRHASVANKAADAVVLIGTPLAFFGLQAALVRDTHHAVAFTSLALGALYLAIAWWMQQASRARPDISRWLARCGVGLGLAFVTLAVPLAMAGR